MKIINVSNGNNNYPGNFTPKEIKMSEKKCCTLRDGYMIGGVKQIMNMPIIDVRIAEKKFLNLKCLLVYVVNVKKRD